MFAGLQEQPSSRSSVLEKEGGSITWTSKVPKLMDLQTKYLPGKPHNPLQRVVPKQAFLANALDSRGKVKVHYPCKNKHKHSCKTRALT